MRDVEKSLVLRTLDGCWLQCHKRHVHIGSNVVDAEGLRERSIVSTLASPPVTAMTLSKWCASLRVFVYLVRRRLNKPQSRSLIADKLGL